MCGAAGTLLRPDGRLALRGRQPGAFGNCRLTNHSSRTRFAGRLNSGVRLQGEPSVQLVTPLLVVFDLLGSSPALAHSGGLNAEGCHTNRKTGEHHCHRGPGLRSQPSKSNLVPQDQAPARRAFRNCAEARAAGAAPVRRGDPGYAPHLDRDNDGVGCE